MRIVYYTFIITLSMQWLSQLHTTEGAHFTALSVKMKHMRINTIINQLHTCSHRKTFSLHEQLTFMFLCISPHIRHCRLTDKPFRKTSILHFSSFTFCGHIHIPPKSPVDGTLYVTVQRNHLIQFNFLIFVFYRNFHICGPDELNLVDHSVNKTHVYCGCRMPWDMMSGGRDCDIILKVATGSSSMMVLFYHAIYKPHIDKMAVVNSVLLGKASLQNPFIHETIVHSFTFSALNHQVIQIGGWRSSYHCGVWWPWK